MFVCVYLFVFRYFWCLCKIWLFVSWWQSLYAFWHKEIFVVQEFTIKNAGDINHSLSTIHTNFLGRSAIVRLVASKCFEMDMAEILMLYDQNLEEHVIAVGHHSGIVYWKQRNKSTTMYTIIFFWLFFFSVLNVCHGNCLQHRNTLE